MEQPERIRVARGGAVETLPFDRYVAAALTGETRPDWSPAALEAQAVACRSYACFAVQHPRAADHDVVASTGDQVLDLRPEPPEPVLAALAATAGQVLVTSRRLGRPRPVKALFHTSCGGGTDDARAVWPGSRLAGLTGTACPACRLNRGWELEVPLSELLALLGIPDTPGRRVALPYRRSPSGRLLAIGAVVGRSKGWRTAEQLRAALGFDRLRSARFHHEIVEVPPDGVPTGWVVQFEGVGHGHGVGLCQRAAIAMAADGATGAEIVRHFYPGATVVQERGW